MKAGDKVVARPQIGHLPQLVVGVVKDARDYSVHVDFGRSFHFVNIGYLIKVG